MNMNTNNKKNVTLEINTLSREGYHKAKPKYGLFTEEQVKTIDGAQKRMEIAFVKFVIEKGWTNARIVEEFSPYISGSAAVTKIMKGEQHVSIEMILVMVLRFGQSLDEILLGKKQSGYMLTPDDVAFFENLVKKAVNAQTTKDDA